MARAPALTIPGILRDADDWHARHGQWPKATQSNDWRRIDLALRLGLRGLPGGTSLAQLLAERRGVRNLKALPPLTVPAILAWADEHRHRTGAWPIESSGPVVSAPGETWLTVDRCLRSGWRGLPGGSSLPQLLERERGVRNLSALPPYSVAQILAWADAYFQQHRRWPSSLSGPIDGAPGETWLAVDSALMAGRRGFTGGSSLAQLLREQRGAKDRGGTRKRKP